MRLFKNKHCLFRDDTFEAWYEPYLGSSRFELYTVHNQGFASQSIAFWYRLKSNAQCYIKLEAYTHKSPYPSFLDCVPKLP